MSADGPIPRDKLLDVLEETIARVAFAYYFASCGREITEIENPRETAEAALLALEAAGWAGGAANG